MKMNLPRAPLARVGRKGLLLLAAAGLVAYYLLFVHVPYVPQPDLPRVPMPPRDFHKYDPTRIDLHLGPHHFKVGVDHIMMQPFVGKDFELETVWPSMRTVDEEVEIYGAKVNGKPGVRVSDTLYIKFQNVPLPERYTDQFKSFVASNTRPFETLNELGLNVRRNAGPDDYWAIDASVLTPLQKVPYSFSCDHLSEPTRETCEGSFQWHPDVSIQIIFNKIHLQDWKPMYFKVLEFIKSIEETQQ